LIFDLLQYNVEITLVKVRLLCAIKERKMSEKKFYANSGPHTLQKIATAIGCEISKADMEKEFYEIKSLSEADSSDLSFLSNKKYIEAYKSSKAGACIVPYNFENTSIKNIILLRAHNPYYSYSKALDLFYSSSRRIILKIMPSAYVSSSAKIGKNCYIGHNVVIEDEVEIGDDSVIESGTFIDCGVKIGSRARIDSNVSISHAIIGNDVVVLSGARIGQDGFGFATDKGIHKKIYHIGRVIIGNDVEIGANSCIDRGSMNDTIIEDFCRIDNLVQIGHNAQIKKGAILVAQVGIAGSSTIGSYCALGGQVGVAGHITITDGVQIAGQGGVIQDIKEPGIMGGTPAVPIRDWHKQSIIMKKLVKDKGK
jgi:UDP-3-O-[3-hydroxymyristoyl] glucosamine N-acyltransferase